MKKGRNKKLGYIDPAATYTDPQTGQTFSVDQDGVLNPVDPIGPAPIDNSGDIPKDPGTGGDPVMFPTDPVYTATPQTVPMQTVPPQMEVAATDPVPKKEINWKLVIAVAALAYFVMRKK